MAGLAGPASARPDAISCLAQQFEALGLQGVTASSQLSDTSFSEAAQEWLSSLSEEERGLYAPLTRQTALTWCRLIGQSRAELRAMWPSTKPRRMYLGDENEQDRAFFINAETRVRAYLKDTFDVQVAGDFAIVADQDVESLLSLINQVYGEIDLRPVKRLKLRDGFCTNKRIGAFAGRHYIAMCWPKDGQTPEAYQAFKLDGSLAVFAHEFMHQVQYELASDIPARRLADNSDWVLGPAWMVEGTAEFLERQFSTRAKEAEGPNVFNLQTRARKSQLKLSELHKTGSVQGFAGYGTARFAAFLLAQKHGGRSLFDYFSALGRLQDRDAAFLETFGQEMDVFEAEFETLRRNFGAARDYGRE